MPSTSLDLRSDPTPLAYDSDGVVRVAGTRVTLLAIVAAFLHGATAEEIAQQYPSVDLGAVYAVIAFYLRQRPQVDAYLAQEAQATAAVRARIETQAGGADVRARLLARRGQPRASA